MRNYEVRLKRILKHPVYATVSVLARNQAEAIAKAREHAFDDQVDWSEPLGEQIESGPVTIETVEAIVDVD